MESAKKSSPKKLILKEEVKANSFTVGTIGASAGGVLANNIFLIASDAFTFGTTSHFEENILGMTGINLETGATINGRMLAQTADTLQMNSVTRPDKLKKTFSQQRLPARAASFFLFR